MEIKSSTIYAPATMVGNSGITVTRLSGDDTFIIASRIFSKNHRDFIMEDVCSYKSNSAHHGYIYNGNSLIDEVILTIFKSPNSFTGEDMVEISSHGGKLIFRLISSLLQKLGATHALPGEFSRRAFLNGKMDLAQCEAVADLIRANTERASKLALMQLSGEFSAQLNSLKEELINYCSLLELELDFAEEGIDLISKIELLNKIESLINNFNSLTHTYESGKMIKEGVNLAIVGKPNVGKSSIFNYLLNESRAIVSEFPGTTRDYIQEPLIIDGVQFNLIDTAGVRHTSDKLEKEGIKRTKLKVEKSDIVIEVEDLSNPELRGDEYIIGIPEEKIIKVLNKSDLSNSTEKQGIKISAKTGENMQLLKDSIISIANNLITDIDTSEIIITNVRHRDCLLKSCEYLVNAKSLIIKNEGNELISYEIRAAMDALTEITGKITNVDILNNIFGHFCIGK